MRTLLLALAAVSSLAVASPSLAQTLKVNKNLSIDVTGFSGDAKILPVITIAIVSLVFGAFLVMLSALRVAAYRLSGARQGI